MPHRIYTEAVLYLQLSLFMHFYPFHIGDYRKDTGRLNFLEHGIYRILIDEYYLSEMPLNSDKAILIREFGIRTIEEIEAFEFIISKFFTLCEDGYHHYGCDKVLNKIYDKSDKARKSAEALWAKKRANASKKDANACKSDANASKSDAVSMLPITHNPIPITHNPIQNTDTPAEADVVIDFESFWNLYPKKVGKEVAHKLWKQKLKPNQQVFDLIKSHLAIAYLMTEKQYIPNPSTYLSQKRWNDEVIKPNQQKQPALSTMNYGESGDL